MPIFFQTLLAKNGSLLPHKIMYLEQINKTLIHVPRTGGTSIVRSVQGVPHSQTFMKKESLPLRMRHPRASELDIKGGLIVVIRDPVDRYKSIKKFVLQRGMKTPGGG